MDFRRNLEICTPYLGTLTGAYTDWTPLHERERLFPEDIGQERSVAVQERPRRVLGHQQRAFAWHGVKVPQR